MQNYILLSLIVSIGLAVGCSDVGFENLPNPACTAFDKAPDQNCKPGPRGFDKYSVSFKTGLVDILFVNDNSGSMSPEQSKMGSAFPNFLNTISNLDYQIAMVTTDVKNDGGNLLEFQDQSGNKSGEFVLKPTTPGLSSKFNGTIKRQETLDCEASGYSVSKCPGDDERGIYAMNEVINKNQSGFLRPGAHLAVVVISDEDERSATNYNSDTQKWEGAFKTYPLEAQDYPENFVRNFAEKFSSKTLSVHSIIIKPGDATCYNSQMKTLSNGNTLRGSYGYQYNILSKATNHNLDDIANITNGSVINICNSSYSNDLGIIGSLTNTNSKTQKIKMECLPSVDEITVESSPSVGYSIEASTQSLVFRNLPVGIDITVSYLCPI